MNLVFRAIFRVIVPCLILAAGVAGFVVLGGMKKAPARRQGEKQLPVVETIQVQPHTGTLTIDADGLVVPFREVAVSTQVAGRLKFKADACRAGNYVTAGQLLVEIDPADYELEVGRLQTELTQADNDLKEHTVELANTNALIELADEELALQRKELQRRLALAKRGVSSESEIDDAKRNERVARQALLTLRNELQLLKTRRNRLISGQELVTQRLAKTQLDLARTKVTSPVSGVIVDDEAEQGTFAPTGKVLFTVEDTSAAEVRCNLSMEDLFWLWQQDAGSTNNSVGEFPAGGDAVRSLDGNAGGSPQQPAAAADYHIPRTEVVIAYRLAGHEYQCRGVLTRYDGIGLDEKTRTVPCRVFVQDRRLVGAGGAEDSPGWPKGPPVLVRGMYVKVKLLARPRTHLLRLPERAIRPGNVVWMVRDGRLASGRVRIAAVIDGQAVLHADESDVVVGDKVVVSPIASETTGTKVREQPVE